MTVTFDSSHAYERLLEAAKGGRAKAKELADSYTLEVLEECFGMALADRQRVATQLPANAIWPYQIILQVCDDARAVRKGERNER